MSRVEATELARRSPSSRAAARASLALGCATLLLMTAELAQAREDQKTQASADEAALAARDLSFAAGVSFAYLKLHEPGDESRFSFIPSALGLAYVPLAPRWFLRPGVRLGYAGLEQGRFSYGARVEEHDVTGSLELAVQYDAWLVPAFGVGLGLDRREIDFVGRGIVEDSDAIDRVEWLGFAYAQAGLGVPIADGSIVVEPYARTQWTLSDERSRFQFGVDLTVGF